MRPVNLRGRWSPNLLQPWLDPEVQIESRRVWSICSWVTTVQLWFTRVCEIWKSLTQLKIWAEWKHVVKPAPPPCGKESSVNSCCSSVARTIYSMFSSFQHVFLSKQQCPLWLMEKACRHNRKSRLFSKPCRVFNACVINGAQLLHDKMPYLMNNN